MGVEDGADVHRAVLPPRIVEIEVGAEPLGEDSRLRDRTHFLVVTRHWTEQRTA